MFVLRVLLVVVACLFCIRVDAQCQNGRCYRPMFSTSQARTPVSGTVLRTRSQLPDGTWGPWKNVKGGGRKSAAVTVPRAPGLMPGEINRDSRAYAHAKREAQMLANSGNGAWHPLGVAPGCRYSGCGSSSTGSPSHCYRNLGDHRVVARACVYRNGRYYWSAHLR